MDGWILLSRAVSAHIQQRCRIVNAVWDVVSQMKFNIFRCDDFMNGTNCYHSSPEFLFPCFYRGFLFSLRFLSPQLAFSFRTRTHHISRIQKKKKTRERTMNCIHALLQRNEFIPHDRGSCTARSGKNNTKSCIHFLFLFEHSREIKVTLHEIGARGRKKATTKKIG